MNLIYISIEKSDKTVEDVLVRMKMKLGSINLFSFTPPITLHGNGRVIELRPSLSSELIVKLDGPEFMIEELREKFIKGKIL